MAPTYKVEELLAVRGSVSESAVSLEKFADEDAIKEHVLRPSLSTSGIRAKSENDAPLVAPRSPLAANLLGASPRFPAPFNKSVKRTSPSPSVKKAKAERLLQEHGSPPGRRVTAGGRIVPTDWTWSGNHAPPYPYPRFSPFYPYLRPWVPYVPVPQPLTDVPNGLVGYNLMGKICQVVDGEMRELKDGHLFMAAPNVPFPVISSFAGNGIANGATRSISQPSATMAPMDRLSQDTLLGLDKMPYEKQIQYLDGEMKKAKHDHNQIERKEVLQEFHLTPLERETMVCTKRELVTKMDQIRRFKKALAEFRSEGSSSVTNARDFAHGQKDFTTKLSTSGSFASEVRPSEPVSSGFVHPSGHPVTFSGQVNPPYTDGWHEVSSMDPNSAWSDFVPDASVFVPSHPGSAAHETSANKNNSGANPSPEMVAGFKNRRSHAIAIKAPPDYELKTTVKSALDPTSPTYEPAHVFVPPTPSPIDSPAPHPVTQHTWLNTNNNTDASESSVSTSNFFPNDAAEHSQRKHTFARPENAPPGAELSAFSGQIHNTTPQKDWVRNSQMDFQTTSPDHSAISRPTVTAPLEARMSSWTQDILPSLEPASFRQSPEQSGVNRKTGLNDFTTTAGTLSHNSPVRRISILDGKSDDWCQGYIRGSSGSRECHPDPSSSNDYKAGFYQSLADYERKSVSHHTTPNRGMSRYSGSHSPLKSNTNTNIFSPPIFNDSAVNLPTVIGSASSGSGYPYPHDNSFYASRNSIGNKPVLNGVAHSVPAEVLPAGLPSDSVSAVAARSTAHTSYSPVKQSCIHRGYSESAAGAVQARSPAPVDNDAAPFLWKEHHLREQQVSSNLRPLVPLSRSGNQLGTANRVMSDIYNHQRYYPELKTVQRRAECGRYDPIGTKRRPENVSHFDGASDELAELDPNTFLDSQEHASTEVQTTPSPSKKVVDTVEETTQSNNTSPKKGNPSPSKAKEVRDRVASTARRMLKGSDQQPTRLEPSEMDQTQKARHRSQWRKRFQKMKKEDQEEVRKNRLERDKA